MFPTGKCWDNSKNKIVAHEPAVIPGSWCSWCVGNRTASLPCTPESFSLQQGNQHFCGHELKHRSRCKHNVLTRLCSVFYSHFTAFCSPQENMQFAHCFAVCSTALRGVINDKMVITRQGVQLHFLRFSLPRLGSWLSTVQAGSGQRADLVILYTEWKHPEGNCNLKLAQVVWHTMW